MLDEIQTSTPAPDYSRAGVVEAGGREYMTDATGRLVPLSLVRPADKLLDETVRKIIGYACLLSAEVARFKGHCFDDIASLQALLDQEYQTRVGGAKGNVTLTSFDGCQKVTLKMADLLELGPELRSAKALVDECLMEWSSGASDELQAIVNRAFQVDKEGKISLTEIYMLLRNDIKDERWLRAMQAVRDAMRVIGSKAYLNFHRRDTPDSEWQPITVNLAKA